MREERSPASLLQEFLDSLTLAPAQTASCERPAEELYARPGHSITRSLLAAIPGADTGCV